MATGNGRVFISYRRQETAWPARQLYELLAGEFGADKIFKDVDNIAPGEDFVDRLTTAVSACEVLLALIGPQWLELRDAEGNRRIDDPHDFVRLELSAALQRGVRVIPILVDGARMPAASALPAELAPLTRRQAVEINPVGFNTDRLVATLAEVLAHGGTAAPAPTVEAPSPPIAADGGAGTRSSPWAPADPAHRADPAGSAGTIRRADPGDPGGTARSAQQAGGTTRSSRPVDPGDRTRSIHSVDSGGTTQPAGPDLASGPARPPSADGARSTAAPGAVGKPAEKGTPSGRDGAGLGGGGTFAPPKATASSNGRRRVLTPVLAGVSALAVAAAAWLAPQLAGTNAPQGGTPATNSVPAPASTAPTPSASASSGTGGDSTVPTIVAHRGGLEVHQFETQQAMEAAALAGFAIETDVRYTKDGVAVLVHDERATKGLDCGGADIRVSQTTWSKLRSSCRSKPTRRDPKTYEIPTLDATMEGIAAASPDSWVFVETKTDQSAAQRTAFLGVFSKYGLTDRLVVTSFERPRLKAIASTHPKTRRMLFVSEKRVAASELGADRLWGVAVEQGIATASYVADLRKAGLVVMIWVPNDASHWETAVKLRPDLVMTAYPAGYRKWLQDR